MRLLEATELEKVEEILINEFSEQSQVDFFEIAEQMDAHEVTCVGPIFTEYILQHYSNAFKLSADRVSAIRQLSQVEEFNVLHLNYREYDPDESKIVFAINELNRLSTTDKLFLNELARSITDTNMYQICFILEQEAPLCSTECSTAIPNVILPAVLLYAQKLEFMISRLAKDLLTSEEQLYDLMPREALKSAMLTSYSDDGGIDEDVVKKLVQTLN